MISHELRCIFIHIPKCASTSIKEVLKLEHLRSRATCNAYDPNTQEYFKFSIIRNPLERMASAFRMFQKNGYITDFDEFVKIALDSTIPYSAESADKMYPGITNWAHQFTPNHSIRYHTLPITHNYYGLYIDGQCQADFVGRFNTIERDFKHISDHLGVKVKLPHLNKVEGPDLYTPKTMCLVTDYYQSDINMLGFAI